MTEPSKKDQLYELIREQRLLGRAYVLPGERQVACFGAANLDRKLRSIGALTMGTSNPARQHESFGGVARNIAENLARLGTPVSLTTAVGDDAAGQALLAHAEAAGIDTRDTLKLGQTCSGTYTAVLDERGEMVVALADMALYDALNADFLATRPPRALPALMVADLNLPHDTLAALLKQARRDAVALVMVAVSQPKMVRLPKQLGGLRLLMLNLGELETRVGAPLRSDADCAAACATIQAQGAQDVIVTRGGAGVLYTHAGGIGFLAAPPAQVVDVTGAGDAFAAAVCWSLFHGSDDLELACRRGLALSAMTLACEQTVCPSVIPGCLDDLSLFDDARHGAAQPYNRVYQQ